MPVLLVATLDTKAEEAAFVADLLRTAGVGVTVADAGTTGTPGLTADVPRERLLALAGPGWEKSLAAGDRGAAVTVASKGAAQLATQLYREGKLQGVFGLGGSAGTTIAAAACAAVPVGIPKLIVSTLASGDVRPFVGTKDVTLVYSVVDLAGLNRVSRGVLANAAAAMAGMATAAPVACAADRPVIAATMFGVTTPAVRAAQKILDAAGFEVIVFHATGSGGRTMEGLIRDGLVAGVLDLTTTELADELCGGVMAAGPDRLTAAGLMKIPQVISLGALDMVNFGPPDTVPERYGARKFHRHNANVTLMRTTPEENDRLGQEVMNKASAAGGPVRVLVPLGGVSALDAPGQPFWNPEADGALFQSLRNWAYPADLLGEFDRHINDPEFAAAAAGELLAMLTPSPAAGR